MDYFNVRFVSLALLASTSIGWFLITKWLAIAKEAVAGEIANQAGMKQELNGGVAQAIEPTNRESVPMDRSPDNPNGWDSDAIKLKVETLEVQLRVLARFRGIAWFAIVLVFAAALLSVADVVIAVPLAIIALLAVIAQVLAVVFSILSSPKLGHPVAKVLRRIFGVAFALGMVYPILLLVIARLMIWSGD
jgi:hypothetical protein